MKKAAKKKAVKKSSGKKVTKKAVKKTARATEASASHLIDAHIKALGDWRGKTLAQVRALMKDAVPSVTEEWKWGIPVWSHGGIITTGEVYKSTVKMTFAKGAAVADPARLFNSSLEGNTRRAIDVREGEKINEKALKTLFRAAADLNLASAKKPQTPKKKKA